MKKQFFTKIAILFFLVLFLSIVIRWLIPTFWCGKIIASKDAIFQAQKNKINTVFIGTSRINHGFNPKAFDNEMRKISPWKTNTYNFGISGASIGESYHLLKNILDHKSPRLKFIVMELHSLGTALGDKFCVENLHTNRNKYWMGTDELLFSLQNLQGYKDKTITPKDKASFGFNYVINYIENLFNIGMLESFVDYLFNENYGKGAGNNKSGYTNIRKLKQKGVQQARKGFLNSGTKLHLQKKEQSIQYFARKKESDQFNKTYFKHILEMIKMARQKGVQLIILAPPLMSVPSHEELSPIFRRIPNKHKINLANANKYPEFYKANNIWDGNHLNHDGANIFSKKLARVMKDVMGTVSKKGKK